MHTKTRSAYVMVLQSLSAPRDSTARLPHQFITFLFSTLIHHWVDLTGTQLQASHTTLILRQGPHGAKLEAGVLKRKKRMSLLLQGSQKACLSLGRPSRWIGQGSSQGVTRRHTLSTT